jgi:hypothetical protein
VSLRANNRHDGRADSPSLLTWPDRGVSFNSGYSRLGVFRRLTRRVSLAGYQYLCATHGVIKSQFAIGTAPDALVCDSCNLPARRVFTAAALTKRNVPGAKALEMHEMSQSAPQVVTRTAAGPPASAPRGAAGRYPRLPRP